MVITITELIYSNAILDVTLNVKIMLHALHQIPVLVMTDIMKKMKFVYQIVMEPVICLGNSAIDQENVCVRKGYG